MKQRRPAPLLPEPQARTTLPTGVDTTLQQLIGNAAMLELMGLQGGEAASTTETSANSKADETAQQIMARSSGHDTQGLYDLYAEDATFSGPIFGEQNAYGNLGKLSTEHDGTDALIVYDPDYVTETLSDGNTQVSIAWEADYTLGWADIHNEVVSHFVIGPDGKILSQVDVYDKGRWLEQMFSFLPAGGREWVREHLMTPYLEWSLEGKGEELAKGYAASE